MKIKDMQDQEKRKKDEKDQKNQKDQPKDQKDQPKDQKDQPKDQQKDLKNQKDQKEQKEKIESKIKKTDDDWDNVEVEEDEPVSISILDLQKMISQAQKSKEEFKKEDISKIVTQNESQKEKAKNAFTNQLFGQHDHNPINKQEHFIPQSETNKDDAKKKLEDFFGAKFSNPITNPKDKKDIPKSNINIQDMQSNLGSRLGGNSSTKDDSVSKESKDATNPVVKVEDSSSQSNLQGNVSGGKKAPPPPPKNPPNFSDTAVKKKYKKVEVDTNSQNVSGNKSNVSTTVKPNVQVDLDSILGGKDKLKTNTDVIEPKTFFKPSLLKEIEKGMTLKPVSKEDAEKNAKAKQEEEQKSLAGILAKKFKNVNSDSDDEDDDEDNNIINTTPIKKEQDKKIIESKSGSLISGDTKTPSKTLEKPQTPEIKKPEVKQVVKPEVKQDPKTVVNKVTTKIQPTLPLKTTITIKKPESEPQFVEKKSNSDLSSILVKTPPKRPERKIIPVNSLLQNTLETKKQIPKLPERKSKVQGTNKDELIEEFIERNTDLPKIKFEIEKSEIRQPILFQHSIKPKVTLTTEEKIYNYINNSDVHQLYEFIMNDMLVDDLNVNYIYRDTGGLSILNFAILKYSENPQNKDARDIAQFLIERANKNMLTSVDSNNKDALDMAAFLDLPDVASMITKRLVECGEDVQNIFKNSIRYGKNAITVGLLSGDYTNNVQEVTAKSIVEIKNEGCPFEQMLILLSRRDNDSSRSMISRFLSGEMTDRQKVDLTKDVNGTNVLISSIMAGNTNTTLGLLNVNCMSNDYIQGLFYNAVATGQDPITIELLSLASIGSNQIAKVNNETIQRLKNDGCPFEQMIILLCSKKTDFAYNTICNFLDGKISNDKLDITRELNGTNMLFAAIRANNIPAALKILQVGGVNIATKTVSGVSPLQYSLDCQAGQIFEAISNIYTQNNITKNIVIPQNRLNI